MSVTRRDLWYDWSICLAAAIVFCLLTFQNISLPGPHYDEVFPAAPAVNFYENHYVTAPMQIDPSAVWFFGRPLPLMLMTYVGSLQTILHIVSFTLLGDGLLVVRALPIILAVFGLWASYFFFLYLFDRNVAIISLVFLLADPGFIFFTARNFGLPNLAIVCKMVGLLMLLMWWRNGRSFYLAIGAFAWGLALYHKADFLWILSAFTLAAMLFFWKEIRSRVRWSHFVLVCVFFSLGAGPFFALNIATGGETFKPLFQPDPHVLPGASFLADFWFRCKQLVRILNGTETYTLFMGKAPDLTPIQWLILPTVTIASVIYLVALCFWRKNEFPKRKVLFMCTTVVLILVQTAKTPFNSLGGWHLMALYPFLHGLTAFALTKFTSSIQQKYRRLGMIAVTALITLVSLSGLATTRQTYRALETTGGSGSWSDAIYDLSDYLEKRNAPVAAMDWGFTNNLIVLSKGRLSIIRVYAETWKDGDLQNLLKETLNDTTLYLFHSHEYTTIPSLYDAFTDAVAAQRYRIRVEKEFFQRDGRRVYVLYRLERAF